jgi:hypothetical protein
MTTVGPRPRSSRSRAHLSASHKPWHHRLLHKPHRTLRSASRGRPARSPPAHISTAPSSSEPADLEHDLNRTNTFHYAREPLKIVVSPVRVRVSPFGKCLHVRRFCRVGQALLVSANAPDLSATSFSRPFAAFRQTPSPPEARRKTATTSSPSTTRGSRPPTRSRRSASSTTTASASSSKPPATTTRCASSTTANTGPPPTSTPRTRNTANDASSPTTNNTHQPSPDHTADQSHQSRQRHPCATQVPALRSRNPTVAFASLDRGAVNARHHPRPEHPAVALQAPTQAERPSRA